MSDEKRDTAPMDRLTRIGNRLIEDFLEDEELTDADKLIVMIDDADRGGIAMHGWEDDKEALAALFMHLRAIFRVNGKDLQIHSLHHG